MQTLLDPFELAPRPVAHAERLRTSAASRPLSIEVEFDLPDDGPAASQPSPDSSGRLRCWCSED
jgi:hypothetical protein